ncbi:tetratricopeptide (TPR) repeat protein [Catenulispora sp. GP43]|uniref:aminoglycoside phosphotransferase family protein n=1 Tax=Catenulispora sp. GP43 TaxID=3156263 RepID=UPI00351670BF
MTSKFGNGDNRLKASLNHTLLARLFSRGGTTPVEPRFNRAGAQLRTFVDRVTAFAAFREEQARSRDAVRVLDLVGVGGIGKTRLLKELRESVKDEARTALLDLQVPAMRQQEAALAALRRELGRQGLRFDRFDIAYAVLWQRLHPHLHISRAELPFVEEGSILTTVLDAATGTPVFGTAMTILKIIKKAQHRARQRYRIHEDERLKSLDDLGNSELVDAITYFFAADLRENLGTQSFVLFIDAYEALVPEPVRVGRASNADVWLRDLVVQLDKFLVVVASREPLAWEQHNTDWSSVVRYARIDALPMDARMELLTSSGIADPMERAMIADASAGVPFYLHLAIDTRTHTGQSTLSIGSREEILQRFLQHVSANEIRLLELLSTARTFDFEIFRELANAYSLPSDRLTWESVTSYSFVYPASSMGCRLHQLMRAELRRRLPSAVENDIATRLAAIWSRRAEETDGDGTAETDPGRALRESIYYRLIAGDLDGEQLLTTSDRAFEVGGRQASDGIRLDLENHLVDRGGSGDPDLATAALALEIEAARLLGDGARARSLTDGTDWPLDTFAGARGAIDTANVLRVDGKTSDAYALYKDVWNAANGSAHWRAGAWMVDLDIARGRFSEGLDRAAEILRDCPVDDYGTRATIQTYMQNGYRFTGDFEQAWVHLARAEADFQKIDNRVGRANILTLKAETLSFTDPVAALDAAAEALAANTDIGSRTSIGKCYTAMAVALTQLDRYAEAQAALNTAFDELERVGYRSGRARAAVYQAFLEARNGDLRTAVDAARRGAAGLEEADVYPTVIILAQQLMLILGLDEIDIRQASERALARVSYSGGSAQLVERLHTLAQHLTGAAG